MYNGEYITELLRQFWVELEFKKAYDVLKSFGENMTNELMIKLLTGSAKFEGDNGDLMLTDDNTTELYGIDLKASAIYQRIYNKMLDLNERLYAYEKCIHQAEDDDDIEYYHNLIKNYTKDLHKLEAEYEYFVKIAGSGFKDIKHIDFYTLAKQKLNLEAAIEEYSTFMRHYVNKLNFSPLNAKNMLYMQNRLYVLQLCEMNKSNCLYYLKDHKEAQERMTDLRYDIFPEQILQTIWNSGWLSPNGEFYGCSDLSHIEFTEDLYNKVKDNLEDSTYSVLGGYDGCLEKNGWVKFSCGRWLYTKKPTKKQLEVILEWAEERSDMKGICLGSDIEDLVSIELLKSKINSL